MRTKLFWKLQLLSVLAFGPFAASAGEPVIAPINISATPKFEQSGDAIHLIIADSHHSFDILWSVTPRVSFFPISLETNRPYTFTVVEDRYKPVRIPTLIKVQQDRKVIYDEEACEVHHARMQFKQVRILYGLIRPLPGEPTADEDRRLFPHRFEFSLGGCSVGPDSPRKTKVFVCTQCKAAYEKWKNEKR